MTTPDDRRLDAPADDRLMGDDDRAALTDDRLADGRDAGRLDNDGLTNDGLSNDNRMSDDGLSRGDDRMGTDDGLGANDGLGTDDRVGSDGRGTADDRMATGDALGDRAADRTDGTAGGSVDQQSTADQPLVADEAAVDYRSRWEVIQGGFVDDPRNAVTEADKLVDDVLKHLSDSFDNQHRGLEEQWSSGEPDTEALRSALQRYRAFFQRLLTL